MEHIYDMIVIGGGPAGCTAALYGARAGLDVIMLEKMAPGGQMTLTGDIDNYPGFDEGIDGITLGLKMQQGAERFGARTRYAAVTSLDLDGAVKTVYTRTGVFCGRTVVLAAGADPLPLNLPGEKEWTGRGIHYCAHCDGRFYKDKTVAVIGGGSSAAGDALYLSRLAGKVYLVHRRDTLRAERVYQTALQETGNIEFIWNSTVTGIVTDGRLTGIKVRDTRSGEEREISCDGVFVSIGRRPATDLFRNQLALDDAGYVLAGESTETNLPGVFAAGDLRTKPLRQIVTAASDGAVAAHFAAEYLSAVSR